MLRKVDGEMGGSRISYRRKGNMFRLCITPAYMNRGDDTNI